MLRVVISAILLNLLVACGGGSSSAEIDPPPPPPPPPPSVSISVEQAARFLTQSTYGPDMESILYLADVGYNAWIEEQIAMPLSLHLPLVEEYPDDNDLNQGHRYEVWWRLAITSDDQLRQRVALALSEIFVVSDKSVLGETPYGVANYYDILVRNAFGNYRELLEEVTLSPMMGVYLSMMGNEKPNEALNIRPDENYAREVMQLFSIGLVKLNQDGSQELDGSGNSINTYDQDVIKGFAHIFTGWHSASRITWYSGARINVFDPMKAFEEFHAVGEKKLLNNHIVAIGGSAKEDLDEALDNIFNHQNVAPFISKQLIQRLVTSNPTPGYIERVANIFNDNGSGVRGDLEAVVIAILMDDEALNIGSQQQLSFGKLKEPLLRFTQFWRAFRAFSETGKYDFSYSDFLFGQAPLSAPSVFNFFSPSYSPQGEVSDAGLVAPEFQILTETYITYTLNMFAYRIYGGFEGAEGTDEDSILIKIDEELALAEDASALVEHLDLLLLSGQMSSEMKTELILSIDDFPIDEPHIRVLNTIFLIVASPQYSIQK